MMTEMLIFVLFQALAINGLYLSMEEGMILSKYRLWLKKQKTWIGKPMGLCIRCMSSVFGSVTFWIAALSAFGFRPIELFAWIMDVLILVYLNYWLYKKL